MDIHHYTLSWDPAGDHQVAIKAAVCENEDVTSSRRIDASNPFRPVNGRCSTVSEVAPSELSAYINPVSSVPTAGKFFGVFWKESDVRINHTGHQIDGEGCGVFTVQDLGCSTLDVAIMQESGAHLGCCLFLEYLVTWRRLTRLTCSVV